MKSASLSNWFQVAASLAVLGSIVLLVYELQQQREHAQAQFILDADQTRVSASLAVLGDNFGEVLTKACFSPESLTQQDLVMLEQYFVLTMGYVRTIAEAETLSGTEIPTWERRARAHLTILWSYSVGRTWWQDQEFQSGSPIQKVAIQLRKEGSWDNPRRCDTGDYYSAVRDSPGRQL
jgi:hypothetical protein